MGSIEWPDGRWDHVLLQPSDKILLAHRRLFEGDVPRYFIGDVTAYEDGIAKVHGFTFVRDPSSGEYLRKQDPRTKIVSLTSPAFLVYELPPTTDIAGLAFAVYDQHVVLTDGQGLEMNMAETASMGVI